MTWYETYPRAKNPKPTLHGVFGHSFAVSSLLAASCCLPNSTVIILGVKGATTMGQVCSLAKEESTKEGVFLVEVEGEEGSSQAPNPARLALTKHLNTPTERVHGDDDNDENDEVSLSPPSIFKHSLCKEESTATFISSSTASSSQSAAGQTFSGNDYHFDGHESNSSVSSVIRFRDNDTILPQDIHEFFLKPRKSSMKGGVPWQEDPTGSTWLHHGRHWPRDYASLRGKVVQDAQGRSWLLASYVRQSGETTWRKAPKGAAIPFFYQQTHCLVLKQTRETDDGDLGDGSSSSILSMGEGSSSLVFRMKQHRERSAARNPASTNSKNKKKTLNNKGTKKKKSDRMNDQSSKQAKAVRFSQP